MTEGKNLNTWLLMSVFLLGMAGQAIGDAWWWPPNNVELVPQNPASRDVVAITLSGEWPNSCIPNGSAISVVGNDIYFDVICDYPPDICCAAIISSWVCTESLGAPPPGTYTVYARLLGYPSTTQEYAPMAEFTVLAVNPIGWLSENQDMFTTGLVESQVGFSDHRTFTYDLALAATAFTKSGCYQRARKIFDRMRVLQEPEGCWTEAYRADTAEVWAWDRGTGPIAWMVIAINYYESKTGDDNYADMAEKAISWLETRIDNEPSSRSYGALNMGPGWEDVYSTEHQFDAYSAFKNRAVLTGNDTLKNQLNSEAEDILAYLVREPWRGDHFDRGFEDHQKWLDCQSWAAMSLGETGPNGEDFISALDYAYNNMRRTKDYSPAVTDVNGFSYNDYEDTVWVEGTLQIADAYYLFGDTSRADYYLNQIARTMRDDGGLSYSFDESGTPEDNWSLNLRYSSTSSAAWYYFAKKRFNPFEIEDAWKPLLFYQPFESIDSILADGWSLTGNPQIVAGKLGNALHFGPGDRALHPLDGAINSDEGTIEFWFNPQFYLERGDSGVGLLEIGELGWENSMALFIIPYYGNHIVIMEIRNCSGKLRQSWTKKVIVKPNKWHHVAMTWKANRIANYIRVFFDSRPGSRERGACRCLDLTGPIRVAKVSGYYDSENVIIDDLRIYSYVRSNSQIRNDCRHPMDLSQLHLVDPANWVAIKQTPLFSWEANGFDEFRIEVSSDRNFDKKKTKKATPWIKETSTTLEKKWRTVLGLVKKDRDKVLYWRVLGRRKYHYEYSNGRAFTIVPPELQCPTELVGPGYEFGWSKGGFSKFRLQIGDDQQFAKKTYTQIKVKSSPTPIEKKYYEKLKKRYGNNQLYARIYARDGGVSSNICQLKLKDP